MNNPLAQLYVLARANNPELAVSAATVAAMHGRLIQAGIYPNPVIGWQLEEASLNRQGGGQQGPYFGQEFITANKLCYATAVASLGVKVADWQAVSRWYEIATAIRAAYYELITAQLQIDMLGEIRSQLETNVATADALSKQGTVLPADVLKYRIELSHAIIRLSAAKQREIAARQSLAAAVGVPEITIEIDPTLLLRDPSEFEMDSILTNVLAQHSAIQEAQTAISQARARLALEHRRAIPNFDIRVRPAYDFPDQSGMMFVEAGTQVPVINFNQGNIAEARAQLTKATFEAESTKLRLTTQVTAAIRRFETARQRVQVLESDLLPQAQSAFDQTSALFEVRGERFFDMLDAQRTLTQAKADILEARGALWQASSEIEGLLQVSNELTPSGSEPLPGSNESIDRNVSLQ